MIPSTRSGSPDATCTAQDAPHDSVTRTASSVPVASITARMSSAYWRSVYASAPSGRPDRPLPRPSKVMTR